MPEETKRASRKPRIGEYIEITKDDFWLSVGDVMKCIGAGSNDYIVLEAVTKKLRFGMHDDQQRPYVVLEGAKHL